MIEEVSLNQVRPMDLNWHLLKEVAYIEIVLSNHINNQFILDWLLLVELQCRDCTLGKAETLEWVQAVLRLGNIIDDHNRVGEVLERVNQVVQVLCRECKTLLATNVEANVELIILFALWSNLHMRLRYLEIDFVYLRLFLDVA